MTVPSPGLLYQINTRVWLHERSVVLGRPATLDDVLDSSLDAIAGIGFDWVWLLGVWQTGPIARAVARAIPELRRGFLEELPDLSDEDIVGSPFAIARYAVHEDFGGDPALSRFRDRLRRRGLSLMLDFVPNHTGPDSPWVVERPEFYVQGREFDLANHPGDYQRVATSRGPVILAHGRDPYFPGWTDTFQLNIRHQGLRQARIGELEGIAARCDGVRCDMAMLLLPDVFRRTWGDRSLPADGSLPLDRSFWPEAIEAVRARHPGFVFLAEAYWDLERTLQQEGFDLVYAKVLHDHFRRQDAAAVRRHLRADRNYQQQLLRFLENHDESRAASAIPPQVHRAAAVIKGFASG